MMVMIKFLQDYNFTSICNMQYHFAKKGNGNSKHGDRFQQHGTILSHLILPPNRNSSDSSHPDDRHDFGSNWLGCCILVGHLSHLQSHQNLWKLDAKIENPQILTLGRMAVSCWLNTTFPQILFWFFLSLGSSVVMLSKCTQVITVVPCKTKGSGFLSNQLYKSWMYSCAGMRTHLVTLLVSDV